MEYQYIVVGIIVFGAIVAMLRNLYRFFANPLGHCERCRMQSGGACALHDLKKETVRKKTKKINQFLKIR